MRSQQHLTRALLLLILVSAIAVPRSAHACDPDCDALVYFVLATPTAIGVIIVAPLIAHAIAAGRNGSYLRTLGLTTLGAVVGYAIGAAATFPSGEPLGDGAAVGLATVPGILGIAGTVLAFALWKGDGDGRGTDGPRVRPLISYQPAYGRVVLGASVRF